MRLFPISLFCWQKATMPYVSGRMKYNLGETNGLSEQHSLVARITNVNFFMIIQYNIDTHNSNTYNSSTLTPMNEHTQIPISIFED